MDRNKERAPSEPVVELRGVIAADLVDYARTKVAGVLARTGRPALSAHVRVVRHGDPARERPVTARAVIDLDGMPLQVHIDATTPREAVDLLTDRLKRRIERIVRDPMDRHVRHRPRPATQSADAMTGPTATMLPRWRESEQP